MPSNTTARERKKRRFGTIYLPHHILVCSASRHTLRMLSEATLAAKRRSGNLRRRIETLLIKAREIEGYGVDIAIILKRKNQYTTYGGTLPLLIAEMVATPSSSWPSLLTGDRHTRNLSRSTYYPQISRK
jgi:hypothetical protein